MPYWEDLTGLKHNNLQKPAQENILYCSAEIFTFWFIQGTSEKWKWWVCWMETYWNRKLDDQSDFVTAVSMNIIPVVFVWFTRTSLMCLILMFTDHHSQAGTCPTFTTTLFEWNLKIIMVILISVHFLTKTSPWNEWRTQMNNWTFLGWSFCPTAHSGWQHVLIIFHQNNNVS